ncbi:MAG: mechanosensitive ion channel family protein [Thermoplasmata archaeon]
MQGPPVWTPTLQTGTFLDTVIPFLGLTVWQLILLVVIIVAIFVAGRIVRTALAAAFERTPFPEDIERKIARSSAYLVWVVGLLFIPGVFGIDLGSIDVFGFTLSAILTAVVVAIVFYLAANVTAGILTRVFRKTEFPEDIEKSLVSASRLIVLIVGVFVIFAVLGMDLTALIISFGAFSIALSFALADIIKNVTSGLLIQADKPFYPGDTIKVGGIEGKVVKTKIRTTVLETAEGHVAYIPNTWFTTKDIINKSRPREPEAPTETDATTDS